MTILKAITPLALAIALAAPASAQSFDPAAARAMLDAIARADANKDGKTTLAELKVARTAQFSNAKGKDGYLILSKIAAKADAQKRLLSELDDNDDGKISQAEYVNHVPRSWNRIDSNGDKAVSGAEIKAAKARFAGR